MINRNKTRYFTLIEMLIVIAVIVILVSLLLPALGRAKYKAKLVVCMSNLKEMGTGLTLFTTDHDSRHINRKLNSEYRGDFPSALSYKMVGKDDRPQYNDYLTQEVLQCPFQPKKDLFGSKHNKSIRADYNIFAGWKFRVKSIQKDGVTYLTDNKLRMKRLGDSIKLEYKKKQPGNYHRGLYEFDILASDIARTAGANPSEPYTTHPDFAHTSRLVVWSPGPGQKVPNRIAFSRYVGPINGYRGPMDLNFARIDGSVFTLMNQRFKSPDMTRVPVRSIAWNGHIELPSDSFEKLPW